MPFVPENPVIFTAAYSGAIAGMAASGRYVQNSSESAFGGLSTLAGAFAQAFDAAWASAAAPSQLEVQAVEAACEGALQDRQPVFNQQSLLPAMWAPLAGAVAALVRAGDAYFLSQGIVSPVWPSGAGVAWTHDMAGSNDGAQWLSAISGEGGLGGTVPAGQNVTLELGAGVSATAAGTIPNVAIRFRSVLGTPLNEGYPLMVFRDDGNGLDVPLMSLSNTGDTDEIVFGLNTGPTPEVFQFWALEQFGVNVSDFSANTNSSGFARISGGGGTQFAVFSDDWSYSIQQGELLESPAQWRIEYASTGPTCHNLGPGPVTLAQFAPPNEDCVMTVDVILTGRQIDTTDFAAWRVQGSWRVSPGTPPTLTPGTSEPTAVLISNTAAAAGVNPTWVLLGDGFASIQGQAWTFTSDIAWKSLAIPEDINDVGDVTFALSPAPA